MYHIKKGELLHYGVKAFFLLLCSIMLVFRVNNTI